MPIIYIVNVDIKDGVYDTLYAFSKKADAEECVKRLHDHGESTYVGGVELDPPLTPPTPTLTERLFPERYSA